MITPEQAKELCIEAHKGQFRRPVEMSLDEVRKLLKVDTVLNKTTKDFEDGSKLYWDDLNEVYLYKVPYSTHPIAVAEMMDTDDEKVVAYLHDILEDTKVTITQLWDMGVRGNVLNDIQLLTKLPNETYELYLFNLSCSTIARKVKIADMFDNMSGNPTDKQKRKYLSNISILLRHL